MSNMNKNFANLHDKTYILSILSNLQENSDNEKAIRLLIDLTDQLRMNNQYNNEYRDLIFNEVEKRLGQQQNTSQ